MAAAALVAYGCSSDNNDNTGAAPPANDAGSSGSSGTSGSSGGTDSGGADSGGTPPPPTLGAQVDRFGRPAVNTALNKTFTADSTRDPARDGYNADNNLPGWVGAYKDEVARNLGIYDGLDQNCHNQVFHDDDAGAGRYDTLASVLADDRQWLNTGSTTCTTYLAVELNATNVSPNTDCGGRKLTYDVIDTTYSVVSGTTGVGDGIAAVDAKTNGTTFPYLANPL
jgi:hypothetical protein